jgi:hypothetical protein
MHDFEQRITRRSLLKRATGVAAALYGLDTLPALAAGSSDSSQLANWWTKAQEKTFSAWLKANPRIAVIEPKGGRPLVAAVKDELLVSQQHLSTVINALPKGVTGKPTASLLLGNALKGTAPAGSGNPIDDVILVRLTSHNKNAFEVLDHLHQTLPALAKANRAVTPNHVLVPASLGHSCPFGPPIQPASSVPVPAPSSPIIDVAVIDAGYWWDESWGQNPLAPPLCTMNRSQAKIVDTNGHLMTPPFENATELAPGGVLAALAGHANYVAGVVAQGAATPITAPGMTTPVPGTSVFNPTVGLWNHPGAFYPPPTTSPYVDGFPTEFTVCVSILDSQGYVPSSSPSLSASGLSSVIQIGFAYATYSGQTGSYVGLPSVAWDVVFGLLTSAHQKKGDAWFVTAPVGNEDSSDPFYPAALAKTVVPRFPAPSNAFANIVGVGSYTKSVDSFPPDNAPLPSGPNPNRNEQAYSNYGSWVRCSANGSGVLSTFISNFTGAVQDSPTSTRSFSGYATWNGTSFASPKLAAAFGQVIAAGTSATTTPGYAIHSILPKIGSSPALGVELNLW